MIRSTGATGTEGIFQYWRFREKLLFQLNILFFQGKKYYFSVGIIGFFYEGVRISPFRIFRVIV